MTVNTVTIRPMIEELIEINQLGWPVPQDRQSQEDLLQALMTLSRPAALSSTYYELEAAYLAELKKNKIMIDVESIDEILMDGIYIHKGDITAIKADAIVNAANEKMLGCFVPGHKCIDNAIGMAAGLALRNECNTIMEVQGHDEPAGLAKVTKGYNLPSKYVVHTVGPNVNGPAKLTKEEVIHQLTSCYRSILEAVDAYEDIRQVVFCSISTGIYGVPIELASDIALRTIRDYLAEGCHHLDRVVIDVFSDEDYQVYKKQAGILNSL